MTPFLSLVRDQRQSYALSTAEPGIHRLRLRRVFWTDINKFHLFRSLCRLLVAVTLSGIVVLYVGLCAGVARGLYPPQWEKDQLTTDDYPHLIYTCRNIVSNPE